MWLSEREARMTKLCTEEQDEGVHCKSSGMAQLALLARCFAFNGYAKM